jgi:cytidylate kinase
MPIITISRGSYSRGKEVAEQLARKLQYDCVSREILLEASEEFNIPEISLVRAIHDSPSVLTRFQHGKERYIRYYQYALLKRLQKDNIVYHGLAGQYFLRSIPHVFKVRILASMEERVQEVMRRDGVTAKEAEIILRKDDHERRLWGLKLYGIDAWDSRLYDMVLLIDKLTVEDAVGLIGEVVKRPVFQATAESRQLLNDQLLAAKITALLLGYSLMLEVQVSGGKVLLCNAGDALRADFNLQAIVEEAIGRIEGVRQIQFSGKSVAKQEQPVLFPPLNGI